MGCVNKFSTSVFSFSSVSFAAVLPTWSLSFLVEARLELVDRLQVPIGLKLKLKLKLHGLRNPEMPRCCCCYPLRNRFCALGESVRKQLIAILSPPVCVHWILPIYKSLHLTYVCTRTEKYIFLFLFLVQKQLPLKDSFTKAFDNFSYKVGHIFTRLFCFT